MPYAPIVFSSNVPKSIETLVCQRIEPNLRDVRKMLESPGGTAPAFNFSIAIVLCSVIGGLSRVFFSTETNDERSFTQTAERYPLRNEPMVAIRDPKTFGTGLYKVYRCNLVHSLGLSVEKAAGNKRWAIVTLPSATDVTRHNPLPLDDAQLADLESSARPQWLEPTLSGVNAVVSLNADALYWGVRELVRTLAEDHTLRAGAEAFLAPWYQPKLSIPASQAVMSATPMVVQTIRPAATPATPGPPTAVNSSSGGRQPK